MARGVALEELVRRLKLMVRDSTVAAASTDELPFLKEALREAQAQLYDEYDWPFLRVVENKTMAAGQRYYDCPTGLNIDRIEKAVIYWNDEPQTVERGIDFEEYAAYDPVDDERNDPVQRYDFRWTGSATQIEVWPLPASNGSVLSFRGLRPLAALLQDADTCDLDAELIVLTAAIPILASKEDPSLKLRTSQAKARFDRMRGRSKSNSPAVSLTGRAQRAPRSQAIISIAG